MPENKVVFLNGKRVYLRPVLRADVPTLLRWINDEEVTQYLATYLPMFEADEEEWVQNLPKRKATELIFAIVTVEEKFIGIMSLHRIDFRNRVAVTGAFIGEKDYWGKGYGTEAKMLLLRYAFQTLNLRKICSTVLAFNSRSHAYQVKCGYKEEGRRAKQHYRKGRYWDEVQMAVFKKDWLKIWNVYRKEHLL